LCHWKPLHGFLHFAPPFAAHRALSAPIERRPVLASAVPNGAAPFQPHALPAQGRGDDEEPGADILVDGSGAVSSERGQKRFPREMGRLALG